MARELSTKASFWVAAGVVAHTLWTSAAPGMIYPVYASQWHLTTTMTTAIFSVYPIVVVVVLVLFGDISDFIGRRATMLIGLSSSIIGVLLFAIAPNIAVLFVGRVFMGIGVGLSAGPSTAALVEFSGNSNPRFAGSAAIIGQAAGFASALLVGGYLVQYAPYPTRLSFVVLLFLLVALAAIAYFLPRNQLTNKSKWHPKLPNVPAEIRRPFFAAAVTVMTAYTHGVTITSLGAQIAKELVRSPNVFVNSVTLALFAISLGITGLCTHKLKASTSAALGSVFSIVGTACLIGAVLEHALALFVIATILSGVGYALMVYGGLSAANASAPDESRGGIMSAIFLLAYLFTGVLAVVLGKIATVQDLTTGVLCGAATMFILCILTLYLLARSQTAETSPLPSNT